MREILFRGKRIDNGEWAVGDLLVNDIEGKAAIRDRRTCGVTPVIPRTVGQFTGLTDKNGKKIFEGDLFVPYTYGEKDNDFAGAIEKRGASFVLRSKNYADSRLDDYVEKIFSHYQPNVGEIFVPKNEVAQGEVIGTIYDNPELWED